MKYLLEIQITILIICTCSSFRDIIKDVHVTLTPLTDFEKEIEKSSKRVSCTINCLSLGNLLAISRLINNLRSYRPYRKECPSRMPLEQYFRDLLRYFVSSLLNTMLLCLSDGPHYLLHVFCCCFFLEL